MSIRLPQEALNQYKQLQQSTINTAPKQSGGSTEKIVTDSEPDSWINRNDLSTSSEIRATEGIRNGFYDLMDRAQPQFKITQVVNETNTPATPNYIKQSGQEHSW
ncbi:MAG: hypothetical protein LBL50_01385, partial [Candidatus Margulisbacteria bacterium]|nr:hypothetical protein [Candidatus Margulisiibacteriota bacterium]